MFSCVCIHVWHWFSKALPCIPKVWKILTRPGCSGIRNVVVCGLHFPLLVHGDRFSSCFPWWEMVKASMGALQLKKQLTYDRALPCLGPVVTVKMQTITVLEIRESFWYSLISHSANSSSFGHFWMWMPVRSVSILSLVHSQLQISV